MKDFFRALTLDRNQQRLVIVLVLTLVGFAVAKNYRAEHRAPAVNQSNPGSRP